MCSIQAVCTPRWNTKMFAVRGHFPCSEWLRNSRKERWGIFTLSSVSWGTSGWDLIKMPLFNTCRKRVCEGLRAANVVRVASEPIRSNWMNNGQLKYFLSDAQKLPKVAVVWCRKVDVILPKLNYFWKWNENLFRILVNTTGSSNCRCVLTSF
jgi:hypothetical protein